MGLGSQAAGKILDAFEAVQAENETLAAEKAALEEELEDWLTFPRCGWTGKMD